MIHVQYKKMFLRKEKEKDQRNFYNSAIICATLNIKSLRIYYVVLNIVGLQGME